MTLRPTHPLWASCPFSKANVLGRSASRARTSPKPRVSLPPEASGQGEVARPWVSPGIQKHAILARPEGLRHLPKSTFRRRLRHWAEKSRCGSEDPLNVRLPSSCVTRWGTRASLGLGLWPGGPGEGELGKGEARDAESTWQSASTCALSSCKPPVGKGEAPPPRVSLIALNLSPACRNQSQEKGGPPH